MTWRLEISPEFSDDLFNIESYLTVQASESVAERQVRRIRLKIPSIAENPLGYAEHPNLGEGTRVAVVRPYVLIFRCRQSTVRLLRVVHGARDLPSLFA